MIWADLNPNPIWLNLFQGCAPALWDSDKSPPDPFRPDLTVPRVLWPLTDPDELKRKVGIWCWPKPAQAPSDQTLQSVCISFCSRSLSSWCTAAYAWTLKENMWRRMNNTGNTWKGQQGNCSIFFSITSSQWFMVWVTSVAQKPADWSNLRMGSWKHRECLGSVKICLNWRIKAEKERHRLEEERKLERVRQLAEARQRLEEREQLIVERLRLEEEERAAELQRKKKEDKGKEVAR